MGHIIGEAESGNRVAPKRGPRPWQEAAFRGDRATVPKKDDYGPLWHLVIA